MCLGSGTGGVVVAPVAGVAGFLLPVPLARGRFAGGEPFGESELEALTPVDLKPFGLDLAEGAAQEMLSLERHGDDFEDPLNGADGAM
jgi:hypothetical protein